MGKVGIKRVYRASILRSRRFFLLVSIVVFVICTIYFEKSIPFFNFTNNSVFSLPKDYDIIAQREAFSNQVYDKWDRQSTKISALSFNSKCQSYFQQLKKIYPHDIVDLEVLQYTPVDRYLYKKKKWVREREKSMKKELAGIGERFHPHHNIEIEKEFILRSYNLSVHEGQTSTTFNHLRVWGNCFIDNNTGESSDQPDYKLAGDFENKLYPWLSKSLPIFQNWKGEKLPTNELPIYDRSKKSSSESSNLFIRDFQLKSNGKGIVIPIVLSSARDRQLSNVCRLIKVLRALKNTLPIEITYMKSNNDLNEQEMKQIIEAARTDVSKLPSSYKAYFELLHRDQTAKFASEKDFPKQVIWFVDLTPLKNTKQHPLVAKNYIYNSPSFIYTLGTIFNSFEEAIILSPHTIPLIEIEQLFQDESYRKHGHLLFKLPSYYQDSKIKKFTPGFHEVTSLIENHIYPSDSDFEYFNIPKRDKDMTATKRIYRDNFDKLIDSHMMIFNKNEAMSGLLLSCNFQIYKLLSIRFFTIKDQLKLEHMWIGQELAGHMPNFNFEYGVGTGILTPRINRASEKVSMAQEICSSSWGQINMKDQLLYVTSYQLDNLFGDSFKFKQDLERKYVAIEQEIIVNDDGTNSTHQTVDRSLFDTKVKLNPLVIENIMKAPTITNPIFSENLQYLEPSQSWIKQDNFGGFKGFPYWCSYDVVGDSIDGQRGIVINVNAINQARFKFLVDIWQTNVI
ncbi:mannosyltransferase putative-domain-containing protein [Scheffersomyces coipomensis]|uniref:mannosyltransferase putative-domain-containing protein n=1 Tax=Scheffersomyces coipomensis TaxID=1788519 RepID=UPI00315DD01D